MTQAEKNAWGSVESLWRYPEQSTGGEGLDVDATLSAALGRQVRVQ